ncbi:hypothetical protein ABPG75_012178 [Micractinium tetrahymenae]
MPAELLERGWMGKATDVYSLGVLLWEMLTGDRAWCGYRVPQIIHSKVNLSQELPLPEDCPADFSDLLRACMHRDHAQRPDIDAVLSRIGAMLEDLG